MACDLPEEKEGSSGRTVVGSSGPADLTKESEIDCNVLLHTKNDGGVYKVSPQIYSSSTEFL